MPFRHTAIGFRTIIATYQLADEIPSHADCERHPRVVYTVDPMDDSMTLKAPCTYPE